MLLEAPLEEEEEEEAPEPILHAPSSGKDRVPRHVVRNRSGRTMARLSGHVKRHI